MDIAYTIQETQNTDKATLQKLKILCRSMTGEKLVMMPNDELIIGYYNNNVVSMCCISKNSPGDRFVDNKAYLYNFICSAKYRKHRVSVFLMKYVEWLMERRSIDKINLDVSVVNVRAQKFFERNNFVCIKSDERFKMYTLTAAPTETLTKN